LGVAANTPEGTAMKVRLIRVFVSSPGDVAAGRKVLDEAVASLHETGGQAGEFRLESFKWEDSVTPQIGPTPQQVVDGQTPECDVYVGIMSTRFGTPTGHYGSGREKEFKDAWKRRKKAGSPSITYYFREQPPLTSKPDDVAQYLKVHQFREQLSLGIVGTHTIVRGSSTGFYEQISTHLRRTVREFAVQVEKDPSCPDEPPAERTDMRPAKPIIPQDYLHWLRGDSADVDLLGLRVH
jgi:hypothetical protein